MIICKICNKEILKGEGTHYINMLIHKKHCKQKAKRYVWRYIKTKKGIK